MFGPIATTLNVASHKRRSKDDTEVVRRTDQSPEGASMLNLVKSVVPRSVRRPVKWAFDYAYGKACRSWTGISWLYDLRDAWDWLWCETDPLRPPRRLIFQVGGRMEVGDRFLSHFRELGGLQPDEAVLDVGCGIGRMALPLTRYLSPRGRYEGFDIMRQHVAWCRQAITPRYPNFRFRHADIFNREYNPRGKVRGSEYRFPYPDGSFDFAFLTSVLTHLLPDDVAHYLGELGRVLRPGGRCLATAYLLDAESSQLVDAGRSKFTLLPATGVYRVWNEAVPEACIALDEAWFTDAAGRAGLRVERVHRGEWCGRETWVDYQDMAILRKPE